jgi:dienelactone hydrolase
MPVAVSPKKVIATSAWLTRFRAVNRRIAVVAGWCVGAGTAGN